MTHSGPYAAQWLDDWVLKITRYRHIGILYSKATAKTTTKPSRHGKGLKGRQSPLLSADALKLQPRYYWTSKRYIRNKKSDRKRSFISHKKI